MRRIFVVISVFLVFLILFSGCVGLTKKEVSEEDEVNDVKDTSENKETFTGEVIYGGLTVSFIDMSPSPLGKEVCIVTDKEEIIACKELEKIDSDIGAKFDINNTYNFYVRSPDGKITSSIFANFDKETSLFPSEYMGDLYYRLDEDNSGNKELRSINGERTVKLDRFDIGYAFLTPEQSGSFSADLEVQVIDLPEDIVIQAVTTEGEVMDEVQLPESPSLSAGEPSSSEMILSIDNRAAFVIKSKNNEWGAEPNVEEDEYFYLLETAYGSKYMVKHNLYEMVSLDFRPYRLEPNSTYVSEKKEEIRTKSKLEASLAIPKWIYEGFEFCLVSDTGKTIDCKLVENNCDWDDDEDYIYFDVTNDYNFTIKSKNGVVGLVDEDDEEVYLHLVERRLEIGEHHLFFKNMNKNEYLLSFKHKDNNVYFLSFTSEIYSLVNSEDEEPNTYRYSSVGLENEEYFFKVIDEDKEPKLAGTFCVEAVDHGPQIYYSIEDMEQRVCLNTDKEETLSCKNLSDGVACFDVTNDYNFTVVSGENDNMLGFYKTGETIFYRLINFPDLSGGSYGSLAVTLKDKDKATWDLCNPLLLYDTTWVNTHESDLDNTTDNSESAVSWSEYVDLITSGKTIKCEYSSEEGALSIVALSDEYLYWENDTQSGEARTKMRSSLVDNSYTELYFWTTDSFVMEQDRLDYSIPEDKNIIGYKIIDDNPNFSSWEEFLNQIGSLDFSTASKLSESWACEEYDFNFDLPSYVFFSEGE